jgi:hypothetical protein
MKPSRHRGPRYRLNDGCLATVVAANEDIHIGEPVDLPFPYAAEVAYRE